MAKHNQILDTVDECISNGVKNKILHLTADNDYADGRTLLIRGKRYVNFASYSYMGLETDYRLKQGGINAIEKFGTQFGTTRAYASAYLYEELESLTSQIFEKPTIVAPSTTLAHQAAIPVLVRDEDVVILDQHVHASVQVTVKMIKSRGIPVELIRHNDVTKLEERIKELKQKHKKIWYMLDGVYSMYGDFAPLKELYQLMNKYEQFHCYIDDTHGISWAGRNGSGYALSQIDYHPQMILVTSLNKAFASAGGAIVLPDKETLRRVRTCGDTLIFSGSVQPPMLGVGVASAKIHLSEEIYTMQEELQNRISYTNYLLQKNNLPVVAENNSPIFFVGMSLPKIGYNMVRRLMGEGFYISIGQFPAVSMKCTGLRMCVTRHQSISDIEQIVEAITHHYPKALAEEGKTKSDIYRAFKMPQPENEIKIGQALNNDNKTLVTHTYRSIEEINKTDWDQLFSLSGSFDWNGLHFLEKTFTNNSEKENNWEFYYVIIKDKTNKIVAATHFTVALCKDDMFSPAGVSDEVERKRKKDPYYLCSKVVMMGSLMSEGNHLYIDKAHSEWKEAILLILDRATKIQELAKANTITLRDFEKGDIELGDFLLGEGFIKVDLPDAHVIEKEKIQWFSVDDYISQLTFNSRKNFKRYIEKYEQYYDVRIVNDATEKEIDHWYKLYLNVKRKSSELNTFTLPKRFFRDALKSKSWEVMELSLKEEFNDKPINAPIGVVFSFKNENILSPMIVGIDYDYLFAYKNYKQVLFQLLKRANKLNLDKIYLGFTASMEKRKMGATSIPKTAYIQANDTFNMELLEFNKTQMRSENRAQLFVNSSENTIVNEEEVVA